MRSLVTPQGELQLALHEVEVPPPAADEVLLQVEAAPINPSDIGLMFGTADLATLSVDGPPERPLVRARIPEAALKAMAGRVGQALPVGNEGAGRVVGAGGSSAAQALLGRRVAALGGGMYSQHRVVKADQCLVLPGDASAAEGASCFVNPLTALGMVETMRSEGHRAIVHTAAASNLGQMLARICRTDGIGLVNVVRGAEQAALLRAQEARHVCVSSGPEFMAELTEACAATGATIGFDAVGGGTLAAQILTAMEAALLRQPMPYNPYGSAVHKQIYLYGRLDPGPTVLQRTFGFSWGVGGWLLFTFLQRAGAHTVRALKARVARELKTTFASHYSAQVSLAEALHADVIEQYTRRATGAKFLIVG
jgi:NADPH:quinone reductase-like Zn-dependent oxidoreductase